MSLGQASKVDGPLKLKDEKSPTRDSAGNRAGVFPGLKNAFEAWNQDPKKADLSSAPKITRRRVQTTGPTSSPSSAAKPADPNPPVAPKVKKLLDEIAEGEGTSDVDAKKNGFKSGYDVTLGYGAYTPRSMKNKPLSEMKLKEVKSLQSAMLRNPKNKLNSSAVGRYQIVGTTLRSLQSQMSLPNDAVFSPNLQDAMAKKLLDGRGLRDFEAGRITAKQFQARLSYEWASIAHPSTNRSAYAQSLGTTTAEIQSALKTYRG